MFFIFNWVEFYFFIRRFRHKDETTSYEEYRYLIAPFWGDLYPQYSGNIYVQSFSDHWVIEWEDINYSDAGQNIFDNCSFQTILSLATDKIPDVL